MGGLSAQASAAQCKGGSHRTFWKVASKLMKMHRDYSEVVGGEERLPGKGRG